VNIIESGKRRVREPEMLRLSLMVTSIVALSRVGSTCLLAKVRVTSTNHSKRRSFIELAFTGAKLEVEPAGVGDCLIDLGATSSECRDWFQIAILGYRHDSLQEPALRALNLNAF
jgi:hypothetical protein